MLIARGFTKIKEWGQAGPSGQNGADRALQNFEIRSIHAPFF